MRVSVMRLLLLVACSCSLASAITMLSPEFSVRRVIPGNQMQAITFTPNGDLYMAWGTTKTYCKYPNAVNLPIGATLSSANATCGTGPVASINFVSSQTGRIYDTRGWEIDKNTWAATKRWDDCGASHGIAIDPRDGAIFVSSALTGLVWRIPNPDNYQGVYATDCTNDLYFNVSAAGYKAVDGITIGPDGTFYGAGTNNHLLIISPWSAAAPQGTLIAAKPTMVTTPDGISICVNNGNSFALVAMNSGQGFISRFNLSGLGGAPTYAETVIANNVGGYLDFSAVDPKGCIWGTTIFSGGQGTYRVTNADGTCTCASAQVPTPQNPSCPNCSDVHHVTYAGESDFSANFHSDGKCSSITFD